MSDRKSRPFRPAIPLILLLAGCLVAVGLPATASAASAGVYHPTRTDDPAPNGCKKKDCSLREAVIAANDAMGGKIVLRPGKRYRLTRAGAGENAAFTGDLDLKASITVITKGRGDPATIDANGIDRIFEGSPVLDRVILRDGHAPVTPGDSGNGGAVLGRPGVIDSRFINNIADGRGGAIYFSFGSGAGQVRKSRFKGNRAASDGGAVYFIGPCSGLGGPLTFWGSRATHNSAGGNGGGIFSYCTAWLSNAYLGDNSAGGGGGGIFIPGSAIPPEAVTQDPNQWWSRLVMSGTTVTGNHSRSFGGGVAIDAGSQSSEISSSTISGNSTTASGGGVGINAPTAKAGVSLAMLNSTLANNQAGRDAGGIGTADAAVGFGSHATVSMNHVTIARNQANTELEAGVQRYGLGGGIYEEDKDVFSVHNSLLGLNIVLLPGGRTQPSDCATGFGNPFQSLGHNLIGNPTGCQGFGATGDLFGGKLNLGQLVKNRGPTQTIALKKGSKAINHADAPGTVSDAYDQRGYGRYKKPDIGAYEWGGKPGGTKK